MDKHKRIISLLLTILGSIYLVLAALLAVFGLLAVNPQIQSGANTALLPAALTGAAVLVPMVLFGLFHIITGRAFRSGADWARIALWILAILNLGNVPLGTAFGAYAIYVLTRTRDSVKKIS
jgi:hypothetical protein